MKELTLEQIHSALFGILSEFDRVCRLNGLRYSLAYGTLLGAVRHKGFIPWDDDVDVIMPRPDYEKLHALLEAGCLGREFSYSEDRGKKGMYPYVKLLDTRYPIFCGSHKEVPYLFVDIFPADGVPEEQKAREKLFKHEHGWMFINMLCKWFAPRNWLKWPTRILGSPLYLVALCIGEARSVAKMNALASRDPWERSALCGVQNWGKANQVMPREVFEKYIEVDFEGKKFLAFAEWDLHLKLCYGDYMTPPPPEKRVPQHSALCFQTEGEQS